ncbi:hypothetical protein KR026_012611, partial [Drosophila bipectinata]
AMPLGRTWSRSMLIPAKNHDGAIFPPARRPEPIPEIREDRPCMGWLLGWEYGRNWLTRREEITQQRNMIASFARIPPDFDWWLNQRRPLLVRQQRFHSKTGARKTLTAFSLAKQRRESHRRKMQGVPKEN